MYSVTNTPPRVWYELSSHGVELELVVNERLQECMTEMRMFAASKSAELKCPIMRLMQIEEQLGKHLGKLAR